MKKNINVLVLVIFFCSSCGFESLHSSKKPNFIIEDIILEDQDLNLFVPKTWTLNENDMYHKKGVLEFSPIPDNLEKLTSTLGPHF